MNVDLVWYNSQEDFSDGLLFVDGEFMCHTIGDEKRAEKVIGETRIPLGRYKIELRVEGGFHQKYLNKFGSNFHKGMLWVKNVPKFEYILIHIGNTDDDTDGCILVGMSNNADEQGFIGQSTDAYTKIYPIIRDAILKGDEVYLNVIEYQCREICLK